MCLKNLRFFKVSRYLPDNKVMYVYEEDAKLCVNTSSWCGEYPDT